MKKDNIDNHTGHWIGLVKIINNGQTTTKEICLDCDKFLSLNKSIDVIDDSLFTIIKKYKYEKR